MNEGRRRKGLVPKGIHFAIRQQEQLPWDSYPFGFNSLLRNPRNVTVEPPAIEDRQIFDYGGGFKPKKDYRRRKSEPSALCPRTSAVVNGGAV
ncbi:MAG: hypothetical protein WBM86_15160 [Waterburya sp.]